jgi:hypothetical protein
MLPPHLTCARLHRREREEKALLSVSVKVLLHSDSFLYDCRCYSGLQFSASDVTRSGNLTVLETVQHGGGRGVPAGALAASSLKTNHGSENSSARNIPTQLHFAVTFDS